MSDFGYWLAKIPRQHKIVIAGNHNFAFEHDRRLHVALGVRKAGITYLQDSGVTIDGMRF